MCHSRSTEQLARFASRSFPDHFLRQLTAISAPPENHDLLYAANAPLLPGTERYYHLDGSRDDSREIAFLAGDGDRLHLMGIPLGLADAEIQHSASRMLLRERISLNGGRGEGLDEDFRFFVDRWGMWIVRLRRGDTPPDSAVGSISGGDGEENDDEEDEGHADDFTNLLDVTDVPPRGLPLSSQFGPLRLNARFQRRRIANTRFYDISTRLNILRGIPHASTRLPAQFISSLDDIQRLAEQLRRMPFHIVGDDTFDMFDSALDSLERIASSLSRSRRTRSSSSWSSDGDATAAAAEDS